MMFSISSRVNGNAVVARAIITLVLLVVSVVAARADLRIVSSPGGEVGSYLQLFAVVRQSGQRVIIDGPCLSPCTLLLSTVPQDRICVTRRAVLAFQAPRRPTRRGHSSPPPGARPHLARAYPAHF